MHRCEYLECKRPGISFPVFTLHKERGRENAIANMEFRELAYCAFHREHMDEHSLVPKLWNRVINQVRISGLQRPMISLTEISWKSHMQRWKPCL